MTAILEDLIEQQIVDNNPQALDDDLPDLCDDADERERAISDLINKLENMI